MESESYESGKGEFSAGFMSTVILGDRIGSPWYQSLYEVFYVGCATKKGHRRDITTTAARHKCMMINIYDG